MATKTDLKVRYHYWEYEPSRSCGCGCNWSEESEFVRRVYKPIKDHDGKEYIGMSYQTVKDNPFVAKVLGFLEDNYHFKYARDVVVAEDRDTAEFGVAILHPKDEDGKKYNKKLGRKIALGRLKKKLGLKTK